MSDVPQIPPAKTSIRLHISPLTEDLLNTYLTADQRSKATNVSFHSLKTFPEKGYGFVDLPIEDATKLKQKLNGSILRGQKIRIEEAKAERRKSILESAMAAEDVDGEISKQKKPKRQKSRQGVLEGVDLEEKRKVMRGWTESVTEKKEKRKKQKDGKEKVKTQELDGKEGKKSKKEKSREMSKYTSEPEMLFKTKLPPNVAAATPKSVAEVKEKSKKRKRAADERNVVVHEFAKTKKHASFLKSSNAVVDGHTADHYVDSTGWVDAGGEVIEGEPETVKKSKKRKEEAKRVGQEALGASKQLSYQDNHAQGETAIGVRPQTENRKKRVSFASDGGAVPLSPTSISSPEVESSELSSESSESDSESEDSMSSDDDDLGSEGARLANPAAGHIAIEMAQKPTEVHPLEALYKRPKPVNGIVIPKPLQVNTSFSFFDTGGADNGEDGEDIDVDGNILNIPMTPFTKRDRENRDLRSAAPTPDTAAAHKRFDFGLGRTSDEDSDEDDDSEEEEAQLSSDPDKTPIPPATTSIPSNPTTITTTTTTTTTATTTATTPAQTRATTLASDPNDSFLTLPKPRKPEKKEESEFAKWFWEHRGENNRAWKKRRRDEMREKRKRENRRIARRII